MSGEYPRTRIDKHTIWIYSLVCERVILLSVLPFPFDDCQNLPTNYPSILPGTSCPP
ncbi:hypothetical protein P692DRAFT_2013949 [Suillus brevipes Sb2]|nr:hypothetical protein P692DRAFT_2013949 [Suillus brevipes Sb2]